MKIGIEMRQVALGSAGGISQLLRGVLRAMFQRYPDDEYTFYATVFNRDLLAPFPESMEVVTLPTFSYFSDVSRMARENRMDVLLRGYPHVTPLNFPPSQQIVQ